VKTEEVARVGSVAVASAVVSSVVLGAMFWGNSTRLLVGALVGAAGITAYGATGKAGTFRRGLAYGPLALPAAVMAATITDAVTAKLTPARFGTEREDPIIAAARKL
jgi:hypothetical protein